MHVISQGKPEKKCYHIEYMQNLSIITSLDTCESNIMYWILPGFLQDEAGNRAFIRLRLVHPRENEISYAKACSRSARRSALSSMPTDRRSSVSVIPRGSRISLGIEP